MVTGAPACVQEPVAVVSAAGRPVSGGGQARVWCVQRRVSVGWSPQDCGPLQRADLCQERGRPVRCVPRRVSVGWSPQDCGPLPPHSAVCALGAGPWPWAVGDRKAGNQAPTPGDREGGIGPPPPAEPLDPHPHPGLPSFSPSCLAPAFLFVSSILQGVMNESDVKLTRSL